LHFAKIGQIGKKKLITVFGLMEGTFCSPITYLSGDGLISSAASSFHPAVSRERF